MIRTGSTVWHSRYSCPLKPVSVSESPLESRLHFRASSCLRKQPVAAQVLGVLSPKGDAPLGFPASLWPSRCYCGCLGNELTGTDTPRPWRQAHTAGHPRVHPEGGGWPHVPAEPWGNLGFRGLKSGQEEGGRDSQDILVHVFHLATTMTGLGFYTQ